MIKHIWFDVSGTLAPDTEEYAKAHNALRYQTYADTVKKSVDDSLVAEYEELYKQYGSNSAVFRSLGLPSDYWQQHFNKLDKELYYKPDVRIYGTVKKLHDLLPISIFTNVTPEENTRTLKLLDIDIEWFTHIISGDDIQERKPALDGFHLMIEKSNLSSSEILYVGDRIDVDIKPAKQLGIQTCFVFGTTNEADFSCTQFEDILNISLLPKTPTF